MLSVSLLAGTGMILLNDAVAMGKKEQAVLCACGSDKAATECCAKGAAHKLKGVKCACGSGKAATECCAK